MEYLIQQARQLHSAPGVARSVLNLTREEDYDVGALVDCLDSDPALTSRVLTTVNSSQFALPGKVRNLHQAVIFLGQRSLRMIALTFSIVEALARGSSKEFFDTFWRRCLNTAWVANRLSSDWKARRGDTRQDFDAYTVGLLSDLGILVLGQFEPDRYLKLFAEYRQGDRLVLLERKEFGFDHAELSGVLLSDMGFSPEFCVAAASHHDPQRAEASHLAILSRGGSLVADSFTADLDSTELAKATRWLAHYFAYDIDGFIDLVTAAKDYVDLEAKIYGIDVPLSNDYEEMLAQAAEQFRRSALEDAMELDSYMAVMDPVPRVGSAHIEPPSRR